MNQEEQASGRFTDGYNCSQSVLLAFAAELNFDSAVAARVAAGFGGGMGRMGYTCGAVTGALIALGMRYGSSDQMDKTAKEKTYAQVQEFLRRFHGKYGSIDCRDLIEIDISSLEGQRQARKAGVFKTRCPLFVQEAVTILVDIMKASDSPENNAQVDESPH